MQKNNMSVLTVLSVCGRISPMTKNDSKKNEIDNTDKTDRANF